MVATHMAWFATVADFDGCFGTVYWSWILLVLDRWALLIIMHRCSSSLITTHSIDIHSHGYHNNTNNHYRSTHYYNTSVQPPHNNYKNSTKITISDNITQDTTIRHIQHTTIALRPSKVLFFSLSQEKQQQTLTLTSNFDKDSIMRPSSPLSKSEKYAIIHPHNTPA